MSKADIRSDLRARLEAELPRVLRSGADQGAMSDVLDAMADLLAPRADAIDKAAAGFDPLTAPEDRLPWLAGWFGWDWLFRDPDDPRRVQPLERAFPPGADRLRALLVTWPVLHRLRGRGDGLALILRVATGVTGIEVRPDPHGQHVRVHAAGLPDAWQPWLRRLIAAECPLHLSWSLEIGHG